MAIDQLATEQPLARCRAVLAENKAKAVNLERFDVDAVHSWANGFAEEWRMWELPTTDDASLYLDFLTTYTSAANAKASQFVTDPRIAGEKLDGVWRQVAARKMRRGGKVYLVQGLRRVYTPASVAELAALPYRRTRKHEILAPFSLGAGEGDEVGFVWEDLNPSNETAFRALTAAALVKDLPGAGWTYVDRAFTHQGSNVAQGVVVFRKVAWSAFDYSKPDLTEYQNYGTEHQEIDESYFGINNTDALANLYTAAAKYNVMRVKITERGDGALNITRTSIHEVYGSTAAGAVQALRQEKVGICGLHPVTLDRVLVINENLKLVSSAYTATPADYALEDMREELNGLGLWNKYWLYVKTTPTNTTPSWYQNGWMNPGGHEEGTEHIAPGIPVASAQAKLLAITPDSGYAVEAGSWAEGAYGSAILRKRQAMTWAAGWNVTGNGPVQIGWEPAVGRQPARDTWAWFGVPSASVATVLAAAKSLATYTGYAAPWVVAGVQIHWMGYKAANVIGTLESPNAGTEPTKGSSDDELWGDGTAGAYILTELIRDADGLPIYYVQYGVAEGRAGSEGSAINQINACVATSGRAYSSPFSGTAGKLLCRGTDWRRVKDWAYEWKAVWIEDEGVGEP